MTPIASDDRGWPLWIGPEVEGRLAGVPTLFVSRRATLEDVLSALDLPGAPRHVFINPDAWEKHGAPIVVPFTCRDDLLVTLAVTPAQLFDVGPALPNLTWRRVHVMCVLQAEDVANWECVARYLRDTDSIRIDLGDKHTLCAARHHFHLSVPRDYERDVPLERA